MHKTKPVKTRLGFSLPEVALSMGIAATALLTLISLLPVGMDTLRSSSQKQAEARILQSVMDRYQAGAWEKSESASSLRVNTHLQQATLFYSMTGTEVGSAQSQECDFAVKVELGGSPVLNGDATSNDYLRELRIRITDIPQDYQQALKDGSGRYRERSVWVAVLEQTGPLSSSVLGSISSL